MKAESIQRRINKIDSEAFGIYTVATALAMNCTSNEQRVELTRMLKRLVTLRAQVERWEAKLQEC